MLAWIIFLAPAVLLVVLFIVVAKIDTNKLAGEYGEELIYSCLERNFEKRQILRNVYLKKRDGNYTEIDIILVCKQGIFVFESKNYSGWVSGSEHSKYWTQTFPNGKKYSFYNPVMQNNLHIACLYRLLMNSFKLRCYSVVVFGIDTTIESIDVPKESAIVISVNELKHIRNNITLAYDEFYTDEQVNYIIKILSPYSKPTEEIKKHHLQTFNSRNSKKGN